MRNVRCWAAFAVVLFGVMPVAAAAAAEEKHPLMTWVKRHPRETADAGKGAKPSPRMGYETTYGYDPLRKLLIRYGGHNQGGGGEQNSEGWTYGLDADAWKLKEPNDAPPGVCCGQQNVFDDALRRFIRFPSFSGSHGWQSWREIYLKDSSVWTYDLDANTWRAMRPCPEVWPTPLVFTYPSAVQNVFSKEEASGKTRLRWQPNREKSVKGYHVYRQDGRWDMDPIVRLTANPIAAAEFLDEKAGEPTRRYEIVAVDALGQEGEPSQPIWSRREWQRYYVTYVGPWHQ